MSFFRPLEPYEPPPQPPRPAWMPPEPGELGGFVPVRLELARTDDVLVLLGPMEALPTGVRLTLQVRSRHPSVSPMGFGPDEGPGPLRLGVAFADGRTTETSRHPWRDPAEAVEGPVLTFAGGGGGGGEYRQELWLWPLPPSGPVTFVVLWEDAGIAERSVELDAAVFRDAAEGAEHLWDPLSPEERQAAHQAIVERHRGGGFTSFGLAFATAEEADDDPAGGDDGYL